MGLVITRIYPGLVWLVFASSFLFLVEKGGKKTFVDDDGDDDIVSMILGLNGSFFVKLKGGIR